MAPILHGFPSEAAEQISYRIRKDVLGTKQVADALIIPAVPDPAKGSFLYGVHGGVVDKQGSFIPESGQWRDVDDLCVYVPDGCPAPIFPRETSVQGIYAGVIFDHFGHFIIESLSRIWYALEDRRTSDWPIYFLTHNLPLRPYQIEIFQLLGIYDRIRVVTLPTEVGSLVIPESSVRYQRTAHPKFRRVFEDLRKSTPAVKTSLDRIYISRLDVGSAVSIPERKIEEIFRSDGWDIVHPESMTVAEQVSLFKGAARVAGLTGSGMHNVFYCENAKQIININRFQNLLDSFFLFDDLFNLPACYIRAHRDNAFEPFDAAGPFLLDVESVHRNLIQHGYVSERTLVHGYRSLAKEDFVLYEASWYFKRSEFLNFSGRSAEALSSIEAALRLQPDIGSFHLQHSACMHSLGNRNGAIAAAELALEKGCTSREAYRHLIELLLMDGRATEALERASEAVKIRPKDSALLALEGRICFVIADKTGGLAALDKAVSMSPDNPDIIYNYAWCLYEYSSYKLALEYIDRAVSILRGNADYRLLRSRILYKLGDSGGALREMEDALCLSPDSPAVAAWSSEINAGGAQDFAQCSSDVNENISVVSLQSSEEGLGLAAVDSSADTLLAGFAGGNAAPIRAVLEEGHSSLIDSSAAASGAVKIGPDYEHKGAPYDAVLGWLHEYLRPKSYLEIGSFSGGSLALSRCPTIAVDPDFKIATDVIGRKPSLMLFQTGSDDFFMQKDPKMLFGRGIDLAFLDGMHLFEFLLRDFMNTESSCSQNSVIALHDCLPLSGRMTAREGLAPAEPNARFSDWWTGDVWKVVPILRSLRPDIKIVCLDAPPTGLVLCTNLSPQSKVLRENYFEVVEHWRNVHIEAYGVERFLKECDIVSTESINSFHRLSSRFWL